MHHSKVTHQNARELKMVATRKATSAATATELCRRLQSDCKAAPIRVKVEKPRHVIVKRGRLSIAATPLVPRQGSPRTQQITETINERQQAWTRTF